MMVGVYGIYVLVPPADKKEGAWHMLQIIGEILLP
jgi:hypothetical protein